MVQYSTIIRKQLHQIKNPVEPATPGQAEQPATPTKPATPVTPANAQAQASVAKPRITKY